MSLTIQPLRPTQLALQSTDRAAVMPLAAATANQVEPGRPAARDSDFARTASVPPGEPNLDSIVSGGRPQLVPPPQLHEEWRSVSNLPLTEVVPAPTAPSLLAVIADAPLGTGSLSTRTVGANTTTYPRRRGYEELPPPPEYLTAEWASRTDWQVAQRSPSAELAPGDLPPEVQPGPTAPAPPFPGDPANNGAPATAGDANHADTAANAPATTSAPATAETVQHLRELTSELSLLRTEMRRMTEESQQRTLTEAAALERKLRQIEEESRFDKLREELRAVVSEQLTAMSEQQAATDAAAEAESAAEPVNDGSLIEFLPLAGDGTRFVVNMRQANPGEVVRRLGELGRWNIVLGSQVSGKIDLALASASMEEVLQAVAHSLGCDVVPDGELLLVVPSDAAAERRRAAEQTIARVLRPRYLAASEVAPLVQCLLTPGTGTTSITATAGDEGGLVQADALLVVDYPHVVSQVESLLTEVDLPPEQIEIDAVITTVRWNERTRTNILATLEAEGLCAPRQGRRQQGSTDGCTGESTWFAGSPRELLARIDQIAETNVESLPTVRVLNRQQAELEIGANVAYREESAFRRFRLQSQEVELLPATTRLTVRPTLLGDDTVRLQVHPRLTHVITDRTTGLPRQEVAEIKTDIHVPLGCTAMIGGIVRTAHDDGIEHPLGERLRRRFNSRRTYAVDEEERIEVLILLTARRAPRLLEGAVEAEFPPEGLEHILPEIYSDEELGPAREYMPPVAPVTREPTAGFSDPPTRLLQLSHRPRLIEVIEESQRAAESNAAAFADSANNEPTMSAEPARLAQPMPLIDTEANYLPPRVASRDATSVSPNERTGFESPQDSIELRENDTRPVEFELPGPLEQPAAAERELPPLPAPPLPSVRRPLPSPPALLATPILTPGTPRR
ncbi:MAG: hypothetical protein R3B90_03990 [Planctomycetaceae bacterium]